MIVKVAKYDNQGNIKGDVEYKSVRKIVPVFGDEDLPSSYNEGFPAVVLFYTDPFDESPQIFPLTKVICITND